MPILSGSKFENSFFSLNSCNKDISVDVQSNILKFEMHVHEGHSEGNYFVLICLFMF